MPHPIDAYKHTEAYKQLSNFADHFELTEENRFKLYESFVNQASRPGRDCRYDSTVNNLLLWDKTWEGWAFWKIVYSGQYDKLVHVKVGNYPGINDAEFDLLNNWMGAE